MSRVVSHFFRSASCCCPSCIGRVGASNMRRLILRLSVGWLPPYLPPSGACLTLGSSMPLGSLNAVEGYTTTEAASLPMHVGNLRHYSCTRDGSFGLMVLEES